MKVTALLGATPQADHVHANADERHRTTAPGDNSKAFKFVPFHMAVAAAICIQEDPVLRMLDTTPSKIAVAEQLVSTSSFNSLPLLP